MCVCGYVCFHLYILYVIELGGKSCFINTVMCGELQREEEKRKKDNKTKAKHPRRKRRGKGKRTTQEGRQKKRNKVPNQWQQICGVFGWGVVGFCFWSGERGSNDYFALFPSLFRSLKVGKKCLLLPARPGRRQDGRIDARRGTQRLGGRVGGEKSDEQCGLKKSQTLKMCVARRSSLTQALTLITIISMTTLIKSKATTPPRSFTSFDRRGNLFRPLLPCPAALPAPQYLP